MLDSRHTAAAAAAAAAETGGVRGNLGELRARAAEGKLAWGTSIGRTSDLLVLPLRQVCYNVVCHFLLLCFIC
jgi:hypothetical protein